ncbi:hypothetical protein C8F01DRAFT_718854 [Mycena amicta]|nr:hypothetical protein C8F01DRAFT_718854 [Mycena amicta]
MARAKARTRFASVATAPPLPPEICSLICDLLGREDLIRACTVSRLFRDQAQRLLFHTVDLTGYKCAALMPWCSVVSRNAQLAGHIRALLLQLPSPQTFALTSDIAKLSRALAKCSEITELTILSSCDISGEVCYGGDSIQSWVISQASFRLTKFGNGFFRNTQLSRFWNAQRDIRVLSLMNLGAGTSSPFPLRDDQLPNLIGLRVGSTFSLPEQRPLQRIQLCRPSPAEALLDLKRFSLTLTTLDLVEIDAQDMQEAIHVIARALPMLVHLGLLEGYWKVTAAGHDGLPPHSRVVSVSAPPIVKIGAPGDLGPVYLHSRLNSTTSRATITTTYPLQTTQDPGTLRHVDYAGMSQPPSGYFRCFRHLPRRG